MVRTWAVIIAAVIFMGLVIFIVGVHINRLLWEKATLLAKWRGYSDTCDGQHVIGVAKIAKRGGRERVLITAPMMYISVDDPDWMGKFHAAQFDARIRADVMNENREFND